MESSHQMKKMRKCTDAILLYSVVQNVLVLLDGYKLPSLEITDDFVNCTLGQDVIFVVHIMPA